MKQALGILGGMGPQATVDFFQKVLNLTEAARDPEHIRIYIDNHPQIPDRISAVLENAVDPLPALRESLAKLEGCGAGVIAIPCITAHYFLPGLRQVAQAQMLDILDVAVRACRERYPAGRAGVLCSVATAKSGLVTQRLEQAGIDYLLPEEDDLLELARLILRVKAKQIAETVPRFQAITEAMRARGADYFLLACTELPLIAQAYDFPYPLVDATEELARAAVLACGYPLKEN